MMNELKKHFSELHDLNPEKYILRIHLKSVKYLTAFNRRVKKELEV